MEELLVSIVKGLVDNPNEVSVDIDEANEEGVVGYRQAGQNCESNPSCYACRCNKK